MQPIEIIAQGRIIIFAAQSVDNLPANIVKGRGGPRLIAGNFQKMPTGRASQSVRNRTLRQARRSSRQIGAEIISHFIGREHNAWQGRQNFRAQRVGCGDKIITAAQRIANLIKAFNHRRIVGAVAIGHKNLRHLQAAGRGETLLVFIVKGAQSVFAHRVRAFLRQHKFNHRHRHGFAHGGIAIEQTDFQPALHQQFLFNQTGQHQFFVALRRGFGFIRQQGLIGRSKFGAVDMTLIDFGNGTGLVQARSVSRRCRHQRN